MPRPALAPTRQRLPTRMISLPPPDSVPMSEEPPPRSEPSSTTTPGADAALDHRGAERAGVEVDEALVHDRRAGGQVGSEADPVGVGDADAGGDHVVGHPRELVEAEHLHRPPGQTAGRAVSARSPRPGTGPGGGPDDVAEQAEHARRGWPRGGRRAGGTAGGAAGRRRGRRPAGRRGPRRTWRPPRRSTPRRSSGPQAGATSSPEQGGGGRHRQRHGARHRGRPESRAAARTSSGEARAGDGYQVSRTRPSGVRVASPTPQAPRGVRSRSRRARVFGRRPAPARDRVAAVRDSPGADRPASRSLPTCDRSARRTADLVAIPSESHAETALADHVAGAADRASTTWWWTGSGTTSWPAPTSAGASGW